MAAWPMAAVAALYLLYNAAPYLSESRVWLARYRTEGRRIVGSAVPPIDTFINTQLPPTAKIMLLNTNHGFFSEREYIADSAFEASQMNELLIRNHPASELGPYLRSQGLSHILVAHDRARIPFPPALDEFLADPAHAALLYRSPDNDALYEIK
jgi:hypothetical protein